MRERYKIHHKELNSKDYPGFSLDQTQVANWSRFIRFENLQTQRQILGQLYDSRPKEKISGEIQLTDENFADPGYLEGYLFATQDLDRGIHIQQARLETDGVKVLDQDALPELPDWVDTHAPDLGWAPDAVKIYNPDCTNHYNLYYCARHVDGGMAIGVATSPDVAGPYNVPETQSQGLIIGPDDFLPKGWTKRGFENIDPDVRYQYYQINHDRRFGPMLYWRSAFLPPARIPLTPDGLAVMPEVYPEDLIAPAPEVLGYTLYESFQLGPQGVFFFSGDGTFTHDRYRVMTARRANGQVELIESEDFVHPGVLLQNRLERGGVEYCNPGHQKVVVEFGRTFMLFHRGRVENLNHRPLFMCELTFNPQGIVQISQ